MVHAALQDVFACPELTVPVQLGTGTTRGFLDSGGTFVPLAGTDLQRMGTVLYLQKDSLPGLAEGVSLTVGALGAATVAGGRPYRAGPVEPIDDGLIVACPLGSGR